MPGGLHRDDDGLLVVPTMGSLLPPSRHDEQGVVDRHAEPDQRDQELDHEADVAERRQAEHEHEGRQDRHRGNEHREQRKEGCVHEDEDQKCPGCTEQRLDEDARALRVPTLRQHPVGRHPGLEALALGRSFQRRLEVCLDVGPEGHRDRSLDECERRSPVVGDEPVVARALEVHDPQRQVRLGRLGGCRLGGGEDLVDGIQVVLDGLAFGHGHDRDISVEAAGSVVVDQLLLCGVAGLTGKREVERQPVADLASGDHPAGEQHQPHEADNETMVHDESG